MLIKRTKKFATALVITAAALVMSACGVKVDVNVEEDGTGEFSVGYELPKEMMAGALGVSEEDVLSALEEQSSSDEQPPGAIVEYTEDETNVYMTMTVPYTYDESGGYVEGADGSKSSLSETETGVNVTASSDGKTATVTFVSSDAGFSEGDGGEGLDSAGAMKVHVAVTFPGEVMEATEGGVIDGNTVTWDDGQGTNGTSPGSYYAIGSLGGGSGGIGNMLPLILGGLLIFIVVAGGGFIAYQKFSNNGSNNDGSNDDDNRDYNEQQQVPQQQVPQQQVPQQQVPQQQVPQQVSLPTPSSANGGLPPRPSGLPPRPSA